MAPRAIVLACAISAALPCGATAGDPALPRHLTLASEGARPPYNYLEGDTLAGFEIDLGRELCRRMAVECTFVARDWDSLIPGLLAGRYDAILAAMEINPAREAQIAFTIPYVRMPSAFLVRKDDAPPASSPAALAGRTIGVEAGGPHEAWLKAKYPRSRLKEYGSLSDAILDLEAGRVEAAVGDKDAIVTFLQTRRDAACCRILADIPRDPTYFGSGIGIGLRKGEDALRGAFDKALAASTADGTFARIAARYFNFDID